MRRRVRRWRQALMYVVATALFLPLWHMWTTGNLPLGCIGDCSKATQSLKDNETDGTETTGSERLFGDDLSKRRKSLFDMDERFKMKIQPNQYKITGKLRTTEGFLTMAIPTINRKHAGSSYLQNTLRSIKANTDDMERSKNVVLVFLADFNTTYRAAVHHMMEKEFTQELRNGFFLILEIEQEAYPQLEGLKRNYNDSAERVKWRSKQVVDFAYMSFIARNLSTYYMQLEDDIQASPDFIKNIGLFIGKQKKSWTLLEFSTLGFIGKMFRSSEMERFSRFMYMFYEEMPCDWLLSYYARLNGQDKPILRKPTLFQHMGEHSSFDHKKLNKLKDKFFVGGVDQTKLNAPKGAKGANDPPGAVFSSIKTYKTHKPFNAYSKNTGFFWGLTPAENDTFYIVFTEPANIKRIVIQTGHPSQNNDFLREGIVQLSPNVISYPGANEKTLPVCANYQTVASFKHGGVDARLGNGTVIPPSKCLRILVTRGQQEWLIIHYVSIFT